MKEVSKAQRIVLNVLGGFLLFVLVGEVTHHPDNSDLTIIITLTAVASIPITVFVLLRERRLLRNFPRCSKWWPALGLGFVTALAVSLLYASIIR